MRDLVIALIVFGSLPYILSRPYIGVLILSWLGYMNPHRLAYGFAYNMPFVQIVIAVLFVAIFFSKEKIRFPITPVTLTLILFILWMCVTTIFAIYPEHAQAQLVKVLKIQLIVFVTLALMSTRDRIDKLIWVIFLSIGFFGIKGGIFTIISGGSERVWGPSGSFIEGNNELALAVLMIVPLGYYLYQTTQNKWIKRGIFACMLLMVASALGSQSRGALLAALALAGYVWLKSPKKIISGILILVLTVSGFLFMPASWHDRMSTIETYEEDRSAMGRISAWWMATNLAADRLTGGGYETFRADAFTKYSPYPDYVHDAHSIYFEVLGEHGYVGLLIFLIMWLLTYRTAGWIVKNSRNIEELYWAAVLGRMCQVIMVVYAVGGAFLGLAYFDLPYHILSICVLTQLIVRRELAVDTKMKNLTGIRR